MDILTYYKLWLKEWWENFRAKKKAPVAIPKTLEQQTYHDLRTLIGQVKEKTIKPVEIKHQMTTRLNIATTHCIELINAIERGYINLSTQLPVTRVYPIPRVVLLDDWLVSERNLPIDFQAFLTSLIFQLDRYDIELERFKHDVIWAHYVRRSSVFFQDAILVMTWYLELTDN